MSTTSTMASQLHREERMKALGKDRAKRAIARSEERGDAAETPAGIKFCKQYLQPLAQAIEAFVAEAYAGKAGRKHVAAQLLKGVDPYLAAYLTVRAVIASATRRYTLKACGRSVADRLEAELLATQFEDKNAGLYVAVMRRAQQRGLSPQHQALALAKANKHFGVVEPLWTASQKVLLGSKLVELCNEKLQLCELVFQRVGKNRDTHIVQLRADILEWYRKHNEAALLARPLYLPTVVPPKAWEKPVNGGLYDIRSRILSRSWPGQLAMLNEASMEPVYKGINGLQNTPWRINRRVLEVMEHAWENSLSLPGIPKKDDEFIPEPPEEVQNDVEGGEFRKAWRQKVRAIHERNAKARSARFEMDRALNIARELQGDFYFPYRLDFRGRVYSMSTSLNPQSSDEMRGLLEFAEGVPLGERGLFWLGVHGANLFGNDKVSLEDRERWAHEHWEQASACARDPFGNLWWTEADKPWSFLAWCYEWADAVFEGGGYVSRLPIALDGSCNGIQHLSAMLRDEVGGAAVNLTPQDKPNDIYQRVADRTNDRLKAIVEEGGEEAWMASGWLQFGINRKITKRSVMVVPYGGTFRSCMEYVRDSVREKIKDGAENPFGDELKPATVMLAKLVWASIGDVVIAARAAMGWLQQCARVVNSAGLDLDWTTPTGFRVLQAYRDVKARRIETRFAGKIIYFTSTEETDQIAKSKNASAIAPNFVHSLDASALMFTVCAGLDEGITSWAMIHDSYGTHAGRTDDLARILREQFVKMYLENDVLQQLRDELAAKLPPEVAAELPPVPAKGKLNLEDVLRSDYFFA